MALGAAAYVGLCLWFAAHQRELLYTPGGPRMSPAEAGAAWLTAVDIRTEDGERLDAWWSPPTPGKGVVILFHGTPGTLADTVWRLTDLAQAGLGALAIDYRGYGGSTGQPSETGLRKDARAAFDFVRKAAPEARIALLGESLGTGVAVDLARDRPVAGMVLNSPFASMSHHFALFLPPLPYRLLLTEQFDSEGQIGGVGAPVMILAGTADDVTPISEARRLFAAAREPKTMIEVAGAGHLRGWSGEAKAAALAALAAWTAPGHAVSMEDCADGRGRFSCR
ncbi:MAG TPA: alpha/beta fold hydrolase [Stellaceae bacterium]|nr:alpha/beta fold hydrolase [Stellaceae bacterium]